MKRRLLDSALFDLDKWPTVTAEPMSAREAQIFDRRSNAVRLYVRGLQVAQIKAETGIDRRKLGRLIARCTAVHHDGRLWGFRGCRFYARVKPYVRQSAPPLASLRAHHGYSGLLGQLFDRHPAILEKLIERVLGRGRKSFAPPLARMDKLHELFLSLCREAGIKSNEYPFCVETQGDSGLERRLKAELARRDLRKVVNSLHGTEAAKRLANLDSAVRSGAVLNCYERVELDGHRIDVLMTVKVPDPAGGEPIALVLERIWLLVLIDAVSGAVLGYHVSLNRNYSGEDVLLCLENAIVPWQPRELRIPGLAYPEAAGLPCGVIPDLAYAVWGTLSFDNAKSNCSQWVWERISKCIGCTLNPGPVARPNSRPFVERFFRALEENGFHRLPSTTGSSPEDPRRREPEKAALRYDIHLDEVLDLIDVLIAQYNGTPSASRYNRSPLDFLRFALERKSFFVRQIPESDRSSFSLAVLRTTATVRGNLSAGVAPYIRFIGARYHSPKLSASPQLIGEKVFVECRTRDLRRLRIFLENGDEFDFVTVSQCWVHQVHDLRVRKAILRCIRLGKIARRGVPDVIQAYIDHKSRQALKRKKPRNELAHVIRLQKQTTVLPQNADENASSAPEEPTLTRVPAPSVRLAMHSLNF